MVRPWPEIRLQERQMAGPGERGLVGRCSLSRKVGGSRDKLMLGVGAWTQEYLGARHGGTHL